MSKAPGDVAKAFLDALPTLDYNKLVGEARKTMGIVVIGEPEPAQALILFLRGETAVPADAKLTLWHHQPGTPPPTGGKPEVVLMLPTTEAHVTQAKEAFSGVHVLAFVVEGAARPDGVTSPHAIKTLDAAHFADVVVPALVDRLWDRRLALGRGLPGTRERIAGRMINRSTRDLKILLGSVAGAGSGRSGAPTAATAQLLLHQAVLVVSLAAIYGISLEDKRAIFRLVAPKLAATVLLDGAEAGLSRLAANLGKHDPKLGKLYGPLSAYVARPTLSASSTILAGLVARRVFRGAPVPGGFSRVLAHTRDLGKQAAVGAGQGVVVAAAALGSKLRRQDEGRADSGNAPDEPAAETAALEVKTESSVPGEPHS